MNKTGPILAVLASIGLAACGGGSGDDSPPPTLDDFDTLTSDFDGLLGQYLSSPATLPAEMPISGSATYAGSAVFTDVSINPNDAINDPRSAANVELLADFTTAEIDGRFYNFRSVDPNERISGQLDVVNGAIDDNLISGTLAGTLIVDGAVEDQTGATLTGNFNGPDYERLGGLVVGTDPGRYHGVFVTER